MSKSDTLETAQLALLFNATPLGGIADNAGSSPLTELYVSLHTADPGEAGDQSSNECDYTGYARVAVARTNAGWVVTGNSVSPAADIVFPAATGGSNTATHFAIGTASSGAGSLLYSGTLSPIIAISNGVTPRLTSSTTVTED